MPPSDTILEISVVTDDDTGCFLDDIGNPGWSVPYLFEKWMGTPGFREKMTKFLLKSAYDCAAGKWPFDCGIKQ